MIKKKRLGILSLAISAILIGVVAFAVGLPGKSVSAAGDSILAYDANGVAYKISASGENYTCDGFFYENNNPTTITISSKFYENSDKTGKAYTITAISEGAFSAEVIDKVTISGGIKVIGSGAFSNCTSLVTVNFPSTITRIEDSAFSGCSLLKYADMSKSSNLEYLGNNVFRGCSALISAKLPADASFSSIGTNAFNGCSRLTEFFIPDSVTTIGDNAFSGDDHIAKITGANSVSSYGKSAFYGCSALTSIHFTPNLTYIGQSCFQNCTKLESADIPEGADISTDKLETDKKGINDYAFANTKLQSIYIPSTCTNLKVLANGLFKGCTELTTVTIRTESIITFQKSVFEGCSSLKYVDVYRKLSGIDENCFKGCSALLDISTKGDNQLAGVVNLGAGAFQGCKSLTEFVIPDVETIGVNTFNGCSGLVNVYFQGNKLKYISNYAFTNCEKMVINGKIPSSLTSIGNYAFDGCKAMTTFTFAAPNSVEEIGICAFRNCQALKAFTISSNVDTLYPNTFAGCSSLKTLVIPSSITMIPEGLCSKCSALTTLTMQGNVTSIGKDAFLNCSSLVNLTLSSSISKIYDNAFSGCSSLKSVSIPSNVTSLPAKCFNGCTSLEKVTLNNVTEIGDSAFNGCSSLKETGLSSKITVIQRLAYSGCKALTRVIIPNSISEIPDSCFANCTSLEYVYIPDSVELLGNGCFNSCNLYAVELPDQFNSTYVRQKSFSNNKDLHRVITASGKIEIVQYWGTNQVVDLPSTINGKSVYAIQDEAYRFISGSTTNVKQVHFPTSVKSIGHNVFTDCTNLLTLRCSVTPPEDAFDGCKTVYRIADVDEESVKIVHFYGNAINVKIPDKLENKTVVTIGAGAFRNNLDIEAVTVPRSVTTIEANAFNGCANASITYYPESVTTIGTDAFKGCKYPVITPTPTPSPTPKPVPLSAPSGLKTTATSTQGIKVSWNAVSGATGYQVFRATSSGGSYTSVGVTTSTSMTLGSMTSGKTYYFKVKAYKTVNGTKTYSAYSSVISGAPKKPTPTPTKKPTATPVPTVLPPVNVKATATSPTTVRINWTAKPGTQFVQVWRTHKANATQSEYVLLGTYYASDGTSNSKYLTPNKTYYYKLRGYTKLANGKTVYSGYSTIVSATPTVSVAAPTSLRVTGTTGNSISLAWNAVSGENIMYEVWRMTSPTNTPGVCLGRYTDPSKISTNLKPGTSYSYRVRAYYYYYDSKGELHRVYGQYSNISTAKTRVS